MIKADGPRFRAQHPMSGGLKGYMVCYDEKPEGRQLC
jgi:hypothetical protein